MKPPLKICLLAAAILGLSACASSGTKFDAAQLNEVRKGQTTITDIVKRFGRPNFLSKNWDGTQTASYAHAEGRSDAGVLLPAVGAVVGGAGADVDSVIFYFDANGVLTDYKMTQAGGASPPPAAAGARPPQPTTAEPAKAGADAPAQNTATKPAAARPAAAPGDRAGFKLPSWLPSSDVREPNRP